MLFSVASEKIMNLHGGIFFDRHKSDFIMQKTNDKVYYFAHKKLRIFDEFLRKNVDFLKNSESKRTAEFYCTTV